MPTYTINDNCMQAGQPDTVTTADFKLEQDTYLFLDTRGRTVAALDRALVRSIVANSEPQPNEPQEPEAAEDAEPFGDE